MDLRDNKDNSLFEKGIYGSIAVITESSTPYEDAVNDFENQLYFKYLGEMIHAQFDAGDEVSVLITALEDENDAVRYNAADYLGEMGDARAITPLTQALLGDENYIVRYHAARALGEIGDAQAVEPLIQSLFKDEDSTVRGYAAEALGMIGDSTVVESLIQVLLEDNSSTVRGKAATALGDIGDTRAIEPLSRALDDEDSHVRICSEEALRKIQEE